MKIYTGYFAKIGRYEAAGLTPISIARWTPTWFTGECCPALAPRATLLDAFKHGTVSESEFEKEYMRELDELDVKKIVEDAAGDRDVVLCCFEKSSDFCHRHILALYLRRNYGMQIYEYVK